MDSRYAMQSVMYSSARSRYSSVGSAGAFVLRGEARQLVEHVARKFCLQRVSKREKASVTLQS
jgi:hypothetical protein